jgi:hypothetical protein
VGREIRKWELIGIAVISCVGAAMHFAFDGSGKLPVVGVFAAVNESVWEHLKLTYWPTLLYAAIEYPRVKKLTQSLYVMPAAIVGLYYAYTAITHTESLTADITIFVVAVALGQLASYRLLLRKPSPHLFVPALIGLVFLGVVFGVFTFRTPHLTIFRDPVSGGYGIP